MTKCDWCGEKEIEFELAIYFLKKDTTSQVANHRLDLDQYLRGKKYVTVKLCEKCLPVTSTANLERYKLRGHEIGEGKC